MNCRCQASLSITNSRSLPKLKSVEAVMPSSNLILCRPLSSFPQFFPASGSFPMSQFFAWGGQSIGFNFNISPSNENPGLISFRMDWLGLLTVLGTLKSPLQHHSSKESILWHSAFFIVQLSHPYMTTGKTITLTRVLYIIVSILVFSEKAMATHSSTLAWKIPWTQEPGGLQSLVSQRVWHDWSDKAPKGKSDS